MRNENKLPGALFWIHGTESIEEMRAAFLNAVQSGIGEIVIESRPHNDYLGDAWWKDVRTILDWCREENIAAYLFDEEWFPSGVAGGKVQKADSSYRSLYLRYESLTYHGPFSDVSVMPPWTDGKNSYILGAFLYPVKDGKPDFQNAVDLSSRLHKNYSPHPLGIIDAMRVDIPSGEWKIVFIVCCYSDAYINPLNPAAVKAFTDITYETTKAHLSEYFGNPLKGFFFDEPGYYVPDYCIPWSDELAEILKKKGYEPLPLLYSLWLPDTENGFRFDFFETLNHLYAERYYRPIYEKCASYGLRLIGHWFEHESPNTFGERTMFHTDLRCGCGNFFEVARFADEGGIDLVCNQVIPGERNRDYYGLPKLASSAAHLYDMENDLALSETFGAYGYHLNLPMMKWLIDWQAVRGINHFIFHAINSKTNDTDCPPYFYDDGKNPQWKQFGIFTEYVDRLSRVLRGGRHIASVALLYPGTVTYVGKTASMEDAERLLLELQYDYDIIPDGLLEEADLQGGTIRIKKEEYQALIITEREFLSEKSADFVIKCLRARVPVLFLYSFPKEIPTASCGAIPEAIRSGACLVEDHRDLESVLRSKGVLPDLAFEGTGRTDLRVLHRVKDGRDIYFLNNESSSETVSGFLTMASNAPYCWEDPITGNRFQAEQEEEKIALYLPPYRSILLISGEGAPPCVTPPAYTDLRTFACAAVEEQEITFELNGALHTGTGDLREIDDAFSGSVEYRFCVETESGKRTILDFGTVCDVAEVTVNGLPAGTEIAPPYRFDITEYCKPGTNRVVCKVYTNDSCYFNHLRNMNGEGLYLTSPGGLIGPVKIYTEQ